MKKLMPIAAMMVLTVIAVGCADKGKVATNGSVTDISAPVPPREETAYAGPLTAAPAHPAYYDASVTQTPAGGAAVVPASASSGGSYTVKKGDTLFSISKNAYGNGNQWQKIAAANPGLSPATLKAGQKITLP